MSLTLKTVSLTLTGGVLDTEEYFLDLAERVLDRDEGVLDTDEDVLDLHACGGRHRRLAAVAFHVFQADGVPGKLLFVVVFRRNVHQREHAVCVTGELSDAAAVVDVPTADRRVHRAGEDEVAGADEPVDSLLVTAEDGHADAGRHVPLAHRFVDASAEDVDALDDDARDVAVVAGQDSDAIAPRGFGRVGRDFVNGSVHFRHFLLSAYRRGCVLMSVYITETMTTLSGPNEFNAKSDTEGRVQRRSSGLWPSTAGWCYHRIRWPGWNRPRWSPCS